MTLNFTKFFWRNLFINLLFSHKFHSVLSSNMQMHELNETLLHGLRGEVSGDV